LTFAADTRSPCGVQHCALVSHCQDLVQLPVAA
jgi:hypothetical protein